MLIALAETHGLARSSFPNIRSPGTALSVAAALLIVRKLYLTGVVDGLGSSLALGDELERVPVAWLLSPFRRGMGKQLSEHAALECAADGREEDAKNALL